MYSMSCLINKQDHPYFTAFCYIRCAVCLLRVWVLLYDEDRFSSGSL